MKKKYEKGRWGLEWGRVAEEGSFAWLRVGEGQKKSPNGEVWGQGSFILRRKAENKTAGS